jgi:peptide/nickel transport system substrate-binding protein
MPVSAIGGKAVPNSVRRAPAALKVLTMIVALALVLAACGGSSSSKSGGSTSGSTSGGSSAEGTPKPGGSITYGLEAATTNFCIPKSQLAIAGIMVVQSIYDTLTEPGADGKIYPYLAKSVTPNSTFDEWTITLRPNITFQDGEPLNADAVVQNIKAWQAGVLLSFVFKNIASVTATDSMTVVVKTTTPWVAFPWFLWTTGRVGIAAPAQLTSPDCATKMIGTGPFALQSFDPVSGDVTVTKNKSYWRKDSSGTQLPYLDSIHWKPIADSSQRVTALQGGQIDVMQSDSGKDLEALRNLPNVSNVSSPPGYRELAQTLINVTKAPFDDPSARKAVAEGIDIKTLNQIFNKGLFTTANQVFDTKVLGYNPSPGFPTYNPTDAKKLVTQYKNAHGGQFSFNLQSTPDTQTVQITQAVQQQLKKVGITVNLPQPVDQATIINQAIAGTVDAFQWRNYPGADPDTMYVWFHGGSTVNFNHIDNAQINSDLDQGRVETDATKRKALYQDFAKQLSSNVLNLWGWYETWTISGKSSVKGILGPNLPDDTGAPGTVKPADVLAGFHQIEGIWNQ